MRACSPPPAELRWGTGDGRTPSREGQPVGHASVDHVAAGFRSEPLLFCRTGFVEARYEREPMPINYGKGGAASGDEPVEAAAASGTVPLVAGTQPVLIPTKVLDGYGPGLRYRIEGELVPVLHLALDGSVPVFFEHHVILWKQPQVDVAMKKLKGAFKRVISGMPIFMTAGASASGEIAFSRDSAGQVFPMQRAARHGAAGARAPVPGRHRQPRLHLRAGAAASAHALRQPGLLHRPLRGAPAATAVLWLHAHGNAFEVGAPARRGHRRRTRRVDLPRDDRRLLPAGLRPEDRHPRRRREPGVQPVHRPRPGRPAVRLLHVGESEVGAGAGAAVGAARGGLGGAVAGGILGGLLGGTLGGGN